LFWNGEMTGSHTLGETEARVANRLSHMQLDFEAMAVTSNLFRAASAVRNHFERNVLAESGLSWTAFVVMWVTWIWEPAETRDIAAEAGISKATLTGVLSTLEKMDLVIRSRSTEDGRLVLVTLTKKGQALMETLFPAFNRQEIEVVSPVADNKRGDLADMLRAITAKIEG
ncbi:MAG: MarR family winged helix-turn-helix transcriptional regulator, partial [Rhodoluna sp.]